MQIKYILLCVAVVLGLSATAQTKETTKELTSVQNKDSSKTKAPIFIYVEQMPQAGYDYEKYFEKNIYYPDTTIKRKHNSEGRVVVQFVINEDGSISDARVVRGVSKQCDDEALRVIQKMPPWKPGKQNGKPVKVKYTLPISFYLKD